MRPRTIALPLLVAALLAPALAGVATASPAPATVCPPCARGVEAAARAHGLDVTVAHSTATVEVHANGTATWTVRDELAGPGVAPLRENDSRLRAVVRDALTARGMAGRDATLLDARLLANDTALLRYRTPGFVEPTLGVLRSDAFRDRPGAFLLTGLGADRLTVIAPEGTHVAAGVPGATIAGRRMTLRDFDGHGDGPFVVFAPDGDPLGGLRARAAIWGAMAPIVGRNLAWLVALPAAVLAGGFAALARAVAVTLSPAPARRARLVGAAVAALGLVASLGPVEALPTFGGIQPTHVLLAGSVGAVVVGAVAAWRPDGLGLTEQGLTIVVGLALGALVVVLTGTGSAPARSALAAAAVPLLSLAGLPLGYVAARRGRRSRRRAVGAVAGLAVLLFAATVPLTEMGGTLYYLLPILLSGLGLLAVLCAIPLAALGALLPGRGADVRA